MKSNPATRSRHEEALDAFRKREGKPLFRADWRPAVFLHFAVPPALLQPSVPFPLERRGDEAFVSLVGFALSNFRVRGLGKIGAISLHPFLTSRFLNVRTYVRGPEGPGIFFLREYLSNPLSVPLGPPTFGLPYRCARLRFDATARLTKLSIELKANDARLEVSVVRGNEIWQPSEPGTLSEFLLERYVAYTSHRGVLRSFRVWHPPWPQTVCETKWTGPLPDSFNVWMRDARIAGANLSPGVSDVWLGRPRVVGRDPVPGQSGTSGKCRRRPPGNGSARQAAEGIRTAEKPAKMRQVTADVFIGSPIERVWNLSQDPKTHERWDIRFNRIDFLDNGPRHEASIFNYTTCIGFGMEIEGWGKTRQFPNKRGSALRFGSKDPKSLIREGAGSWQYETHPDGTRFYTTYDYRTRFGGLGKSVDRFFFRPLLQWGTRWSFDRLRIWIEREIPPETTFRLWLLKVTSRWFLGLVWIVEGLVPKILHIHSDELSLVERSGLFWISPEVTIQSIGAIEIAAGILLLTGWKERLGAVLSTSAIILFTFLVCMNDPMALAEPYGGIVKNLGLIVCGLAIWILAPITPKASRAANGNPKGKS